MNNTRNDFLSTLKSKNDILIVAYELGFKGNRLGSYVQGECPQHGSTHGTCLTIWPGIQGFKCYHCGASGDVINLMMLFKRCDFKYAIKFLADRVGMHLDGGKEMTPEEKAKLKADIREEKLVYDMLTKAVGWYHSQLIKYPDIMDHLKKHYGFSQDIIDEQQIGFSPPGSSLPLGTSELAAYLETIPEFKGKLALTGLFSFKNPEGPYYDYFKGRITFPYWLTGKSVYLAARATKLTPNDIYECIRNKDGTIKLDDKSTPELIKYKKLRIYDQNDEKRRQFSRFIQNDVFIGEDTVRGKDTVIITEGIPDVISAMDKGFAAISPATVKFRDEDLEKLKKLISHAKTVYIINDNEENNAGYDGAMETGIHLTKLGKIVSIVILPKPDGVKKIDLNEYLKDHTADDLRQVMASAKTVMQILIDKLPPDFPKAQVEIKSKIAPILIELDDITRKHYLAIIKKHVNTTPAVLTELIETVKKEKEAQEQQKQVNNDAQVDPEIEKAAADLAMDPELFRKRLDVINESGVVGERKVLAMYCCAIDSRLLPHDKASPNTLAVKNAGHFGSGKSYPLAKTVQFFPNNAYCMIANASAKSLYYLEGGLKNKCLIVTEGFQFESGKAEDSEFVYVTRSLLSEGEVAYLVTEKDEDGKHVTMERRLQGPTPFITTTIMEKLEPQLEDRLFTIHPNESVDQTKDIIDLTAKKKAGMLKQTDEKLIKIWQQFHSSLKPVQVIIPFAPEIGKIINKNGAIPIPTRRAFNRVMIVVQAIACVYQHQRKKTDKGEVIAEIDDYEMALQVVNEAFRESLGQQDQKTEDRITFIQENGPITHRDLTKKYAVAASSMTAWISKKVRDGILTWCDGYGNLFNDKIELTRAKHTGTAFIKISDSYSPDNTTGLPTSAELTGDPEWNEGGKFYRIYDLKLLESGPDQVFEGVSREQNTQSNTSNEGQPNDIITDYDDDNGGVRVFVQNPGYDDEKNITNETMIPRQDIQPIENFEDVLQAVQDKVLESNARVTPNICKNGCKHYDAVNDVNTGEFKEFCCHDNKCNRISTDVTCSYFEPKVKPLPEGLMTF